ncbi:MAG: GntR family transcriptional regulator [Gammaproteobacteria bacterium]|nr:GntR family transcriptional regulator [Gammaproteobacteria bacterium]MYD76295.1 GntR family transcriptional regulator [Gammaproteobacteria bacterium]
MTMDSSRKNVVRLAPIPSSTALKNHVVDALKSAIADMDIYTSDEPIRLDERKLAKDLNISRTPVREAIMSLEREGVVKLIPRRGAFVVRKTMSEIIEMIRVWAVLEGLAARIVVENASDREIGELRSMFISFDEDRQPKACIDEYSKQNIEFHQSLIRISKSAVLIDICEGLFFHMRVIRHKTIREGNRATDSIIDHMKIIEALESREADKAEQLVREHALNLAEHLKTNLDIE